MDKKKELKTAISMLCNGKNMLKLEGIFEELPIGDVRYLWTMVNDEINKRSERTKHLTIRGLKNGKN